MTVLAETNVCGTPVNILAILMYSQEILQRIDGYSEKSRYGEAENRIESVSQPCHEHAAFALHSPICSQIRFGGVRQCADGAAG
jgi:hypothetical protein